MLGLLDPAEVGRQPFAPSSCTIRLFKIWNAALSFC